MTLPVALPSATPVPARGRHPVSVAPPVDAARGLRRMERASALGDLNLVLDELGLRYPELAPGVIRQQAVEVLCLGAPERLSPALVGRLVEARLLALL